MNVLPPLIVISYIFLGIAFFSIFIDVLNMRREDGAVKSPLCDYILVAASMVWPVTASILVIILAFILLKRFVIAAIYDY